MIYTLNLLILLACVGLVVIVCTYVAKLILALTLKRRMPQIYWQAVGAALILAGAFLGILAMMMPTAVSVAGVDVANLALMHRQSMFLTTAGVLAVVGAITTLRRSRG